MALLVIGCSDGGQFEPAEKHTSANKHSTLKISCPEFKNGEGIPVRYTCMGENISMPLHISGVPENTKSLALIFDDPDASRGAYVHWVMFNIPPNIRELPRNCENELGFDIDQVKIAHPYWGPCPPIGMTHHYSLRLYALDTLFDVGKEYVPVQWVTELSDKMQGHILDEAVYIGRFSRNKEITF